MYESNTGEPGTCVLRYRFAHNSDSFILNSLINEQVTIGNLPAYGDEKAARPDASAVIGQVINIYIRKVPTLSANQPDQFEPVYQGIQRYHVQYVKRLP